MDKHFLITVSENQSAHYGARFVGHFFANKDNIKLTLFYTVSRGPQLWGGEKDLESVRDAELQQKKSDNRGRKALNMAKKELISLGFKEEQIHTKLQPRQFSKAMDILQEGAKGLYDSVVLGRRGLSRIEEAFDESVSKEVLAYTYDFPVWICRRPDLERKDILVCVDGTEPSKHMVDHVGYILAGEKSQKITLFSANNAPRKSTETLDAIFDEATRVLEKYKFPLEMVTTKVVEENNPANAILKEAENGAYSAVAVGRRVVGQSLFKKMFFGSVGMKLMRELEKAALWICY